MSFQLPFYTIFSLLLLFGVSILLLFWGLKLLRKSNNRAYDQAKQLLRQLDILHKLPVAHLKRQSIYDSNGNIIDFKILAVNDLFCETFNCVREQVVNRLASEVLAHYNYLNSLDEEQDGEIIRIKIFASLQKVDFFDKVILKDGDDIVDAFLICRTNEHLSWIENDKIAEFNKRIIESTPDPIYLIDSKGGILSLFNTPSNNIPHFPTHEVVGKNICEFNNDLAANAKLLHALKEVIKTKANQQLYINYLTSDQQELNLLVRLVHYDLEKVIVFVHNCSQIEQVYSANLPSREELEQLNEQYKLSLMCKQLTSWSINIPEGKIEWIDYTSSTLNRSKLKQSKSLSDASLSIDPSDVEKNTGLFQSILTGDINTFSVAYRVLERPDSTNYIWLESHGIVSKRDANGHPTQVVGASQNIHQRKVDEAGLQNLKNKAEETNSLKSIFLAKMSQELQIPLNTLVSSATAIANATNEDQKTKHLRLIDEQQHMLRQMSNDILELSKIETPSCEQELTDIDINVLLQNCVKRCKAEVADRPEVTVQLDSLLPNCTIQTNQNLLLLIINNLASNAVKVTQKGRISFGYNQVKGNLLRCYVNDTGCGISPENQKNIFNQITQTNEALQDSHLGLLLCKAAVEKLGGTIGVESLANKGSNFWFTIPLSSPLNSDLTEEITAEIQPELSEKSASKPNILIAEDNHFNYKLYESILKKEYNLIHAENGEEAVEYFQQNEIDLILMDIKMPIMDGYQATAQIRKLAPNIPIIAITAHAFQEDEKRVMTSGFNHYLTKPIHSTTLRSKMVELLSL